MRKLRQWKIARTVAREAWIHCSGNTDEAMSEVDADLQSLGLDPATIALIIEIALMFFNWWRQHNVSRPSRLPQVGEPVYQGDE